MKAPLSSCKSKSPLCPHVRVKAKSRAWKRNCKWGTRSCGPELAGQFQHTLVFLAETGSELKQVKKHFSSQITERILCVRGESPKREPCREMGAMKGQQFQTSLKKLYLDVSTSWAPKYYLFFFSTVEHETDLLKSWGANCTQACLNWPFALQSAGEHGVSEVLLGLPALELFHSCWRAASLQVF